MPGEIEKWQWLEVVFSNLCRLYGYSEIRTPTFEDTDLFVRSSGDTSEVVSKQMYTFIDKGDRSITLKPEGTAPAIRAYLEHSLAQQGQVTRLWYCTPIFRYERPQKGRCREAHQVGVELIGSSSPVADAEVIELTVEFYRRLGLPDIKVLLNCIGRGATRQRFSEAILGFVSSWLADQTEETKAKTRKNPLRLLDTKDDALKAMLAGAPSIHDYLEDDSKRHFDEVQAHLNDMDVPFEVHADIVRGLDYYTDTVFEVHGVGLGSQSALCGGGRYDNLVKEMGGPDTPSVGVAMGIERALIAVEAAGVQVPYDRLDVYVVADNEDNCIHAQTITRLLRRSGISAQCSLGFESMQKQMKAADRFDARIALILGGRERLGGVIQIHDMKDRSEQSISLDVSLLSNLRELLNVRKVIEQSDRFAKEAGFSQTDAAVGKTLQKLIGDLLRK